MMWFGIIIVPGYLIYRSLKEENDSRAKNILFLLSMGIPGSGHLAIGKYRRGLFFLAAGSIIWAVDFYLFFITPLAFVPTLLFWLYAARDVYRRAGDDAGGIAKQ
jgi:TM2 domain-containing membrane protein YozV